MIVEFELDADILEEFNTYCFDNMLDRDTVIEELIKEFLIKNKKVK